MTEEHDSGKCPLENVHRRMEDAHNLWHQASAAYFRPDDFRVAVQNLIQTLRTVTWLLQNQKRQFKNFDSWYGPWQDRMKADAIMRWSVDARNQIEKRGDLESQSKVRAEVLASYLQEFPLVDVEAGLFEALDALFKKVPRNILEKHVIENGVLKVARCWVANSLPDHELLEALGHVYGQLSLLVDDAHRALGVPVPTKMQAHGASLEPLPGGGPSDGRLPCMVGHDQRTSLLIALKTGQPLAFETRTSVATKEELEVAKAKYGPIDEGKATDAHKSFVNLATFYFSMAQKIFLADGYHSSMTMLFSKNKPITHMQTNFADRAEKYLMMRAVAAEVERYNADAVMLIGEIWMAPINPGEPFTYASDMPSRKEYLALNACSAQGEQLSIVAEIVRAGEKVSLKEPTTLHGGIAPMFEPVREIWRKQAQCS